MKINNSSATNLSLLSRDFVLIMVVNFASFMGYQLFPSSLPLYAAGLGAPQELLGLLMAFATFSALAIRPFAGIIVDRGNRHSVMLVGIVVMVLSTALIALVPVFGVLLAIRLVQGVGWGCTTTANSTVASDVIPKPRFAEGMGYFGLSIALALAIAPGLGIVILDTMGIDVLVGISIACMAVAFAISFAITYQTFGPSASSKVVSSENPGVTEVAKVTERHWTHNLIERAAIFPSITMFFNSFAYGFIITFIAIVAQDRGIDGIAWFFTVYALATLLARPISGRIADRWGYTPNVITGVALLVPALVLIAYAQSLLTLLVAGALFGVGYGTLQASLQAMAVVAVPPQRRGAANATYLLGFDGGMGVGSLVSGALVGLLGFQGLFLFAAAAPLVSGATYAIGKFGRRRS